MEAIPKVSVSKDRVIVRRGDDAITLDKEQARLIRDDLTKAIIQATRYRSYKKGDLVRHIQTGDIGIVGRILLRNDAYEVFINLFGTAVKLETWQAEDMDIIYLHHYQ